MTFLTRLLNGIAAALALFLMIFVPLRLNASAPDTSDTSAPTTEMDIVETAIAGGFDTLVAAVQAAGLVETLKGDGPFTVFAPTDEAFAKLPAGTVESLLLPQNRDKLIAILTYHVVPGSVMARDVVKLDSAPTLQGSAVDISTHHDAVMINDARVITADVEATNGVVHVIDTVLMPPSDY